jgi:hypothetical protein
MNWEILRFTQLGLVQFSGALRPIRARVAGDGLALR